MKGKLIKTDNTYILTTNLYEDEVFAIADFDKSNSLDKYKLSIKNCEAIENGYDLDSIVNKIDTPEGYDQYQYDSGIRKGFELALEILGDKKFSEFLDKEKELGISDIKTIERIQWYYKTYFDKSQQTEWDVEIVTKPFTEVSEGFNLEQKREPKLDSNGCLILRKI